MNSFVNNSDEESTQSSWLLAHINQESPVMYMSSALCFYVQDD
jgi:hypothetical protein